MDPIPPPLFHSEQDEGDRLWVANNMWDLTETTPLYWACYKGDMRVIDRLVAKFGAKVKMRVCFESHRRHHKLASQLPFASLIC